MIGFELTGRGKHGFFWKSSAWTEGSTWLLQQALKLGNRLPMMPAEVDASLPHKIGLGAVHSYLGPGNVEAHEVSAIENMFKKFKLTLLYDVANLGLDVYLVVWGDVHFTHNFLPNMSGDQAALELLRKVEDADLGDQVVIHLCRCIQDFRLEVIMKDQSNLWLYVKIEL